MGGYGSGWKGPKTTTVEDCLCLSISAMLKKNALIDGAITRGNWQWGYDGPDPHAEIAYIANLVDPDAAWLRLIYTARGHPMDYRIEIVATQPTFGGRRWWFLCPVDRKDGGPPRRVTKLFRPPDGRYFGSRQAYGLTYTSCQESGKFNRLYRQLAEELGRDPASIKRVLKRL
jgi:hypothetical protein